MELRKAPGGFLGDRLPGDFSKWLQEPDCFPPPHSRALQTSSIWSSRPLDVSLEYIVSKPLTNFPPLSPVFSSDCSKLTIYLVWIKVQIHEPQAHESSEHKTSTILFHGSLQKLTMISYSYSTTKLVISPSSKEWGSVQRTSVHPSIPQVQI